MTCIILYVNTVQFNITYKVESLKHIFRNCNFIKLRDVACEILYNFFYLHLEFSDQTNLVID